MTQYYSHQSNENIVNTGYWEGFLHQGPGTTRQGKYGFRKNRELKPPRGAPRDGGTYRKGGMEASAPIIYLPA